MRLLIIEQVERNARLIETVLAPLSLDIDAVYSAQDGRHYIASGIYDIVIYGWTIPSSEWMHQAGDVVAITEELVACDTSQILVSTFRRELLPWMERRVHQETIIPVGDMTLNATSRRLTCKDHTVSLTPTEMHILELLIQTEEPVRKDTIVQSVFQKGISSNQVEVYISYLRQKLRTLHSTVRIRTIRQVGYLLETS